MKNWQIILDDSDGPDGVVWVWSELDAEEISRMTGKIVTELPSEFTEIYGMDGEFPLDFQCLIINP